MFIVWAKKWSLKFLQVGMKVWRQIMSPRTPHGFSECSGPTLVWSPWSTFDEIEWLFGPNCYSLGWTSIQPEVESGSYSCSHDQDDKFGYKMYLLRVMNTMVETYKFPCGNYISTFKALNKIVFYGLGNLWDPRGLREIIGSMRSHPLTVHNHMR